MVKENDRTTDSDRKSSEVQEKKRGSKNEVLFLPLARSSGISNKDGAQTLSPSIPQRALFPVFD